VGEQNKDDDVKKIPAGTSDKEKKMYSQWI
jgi:hypothetical protein